VVVTKKDIGGEIFEQSNTPRGFACLFMHAEGAQRSAAAPKHSTRARI
jgi:hypothetical protein